MKILLTSSAAAALVTLNAVHGFSAVPLRAQELAFVDSVSDPSVNENVPDVTSFFGDPTSRTSEQTTEAMSATENSPTKNTQDDTCMQATSALASSIDLSDPSTLEVVADKYVLLDGGQETTSGKSVLQQAFVKSERTGEPIGEPLVVKRSDNAEALAREHANYEAVGNDGELFVELHAHVPPTKDEPDAMLVMERGSQDLKDYIEQHGPLTGNELRQAAFQVTKCLHAFHSKDLVWTELKAENFVLTEGAKEEDTIIKGIDLESAVPHQDSPIDYTPKACPPEFALPFLCGKEPELEMDYSFDVWSLGILYYKMATGEHFFSPDQQSCNVGIATTLRHLSQDELNSKLQMEFGCEPSLQDLLQRCLNIDPEYRPSSLEILQHPYFEEME